MKCKKFYPQDEKKLMIQVFSFFVVINCFASIGICAYTIFQCNLVNINWFLPIDIITILIALIILNIIILVVGISSAITNASFTWMFFHIFMISMLSIQLIMSYFTSNSNKVTGFAESAWINAYEDERSELQTDLLCCGFIDSTHYPYLPCPIQKITDVTQIGDEDQFENITIGCKQRITNITDSICHKMLAFTFISFLFTIFIDFVGCSICFHPNFYVYDEKTDSVVEFSESNSHPSTPLYEPLFEHAEFYT